MNEGTSEPGQLPQLPGGQYGSIRRIYRPPASENPTVTCRTCGATFAPSYLHPELRLADSSVLEAALMSMSHFCFRCRRAACPECWDHVHRICGACVSELGLPFRRDVPPLEGTLFVPAPPAVASISSTPEVCPCQTSNPSGLSPSQEPLLTCIQAGRFRTPGTPSPFIAAIETVEMQSVRSPIRPDQDSAEANRPVTAASPDNSATASSPTSLATREQAPLPRSPNSPSASSPSPQQASPARRGQPHLSTLQIDLSPSPQVATPCQPARSAVPPWLSLPLLTIFTLILAALLLAELSPSFNALLIRELHVDIRGTINLFLQWVQWFH